LKPGSVSWESVDFRAGSVEAGLCELGGVCWVRTWGFFPEAEAAECCGEKGADLSGVSDPGFNGGLWASTGG
jgi:hypothetical protein